MTSETNQILSERIEEVKQDSITEVGTTYEESPLTLLPDFIHKRELNNLWHYYAIEIVDSLHSSIYSLAQAAKRKGSTTRPYKECNNDCMGIQYSYADSVVYRHPDKPYFGKRLMDLEYRYCKDCKRIMPKSVLLELEPKIARKRSQKRKENTPVFCPCCDKRTAHVKVLIRKTKMGQSLFKGEGY